VRSKADGCLNRLAFNIDVREIEKLYQDHLMNPDFRFDFEDGSGDGLETAPKQTTVKVSKTKSRDVRPEVDSETEQEEEDDDEIVVVQTKVSKTQKPATKRKITVKVSKSVKLNKKTKTTKALPGLVKKKKSRIYKSESDSQSEDIPILGKNCSLEDLLPHNYY
jgi:hypothetical protein